MLQAGISNTDQEPREQAPGTSTGSEDDSAGDSNDDSETDSKQESHTRSRQQTQDHQEGNHSDSSSCRDPSSENSSKHKPDTADSIFVKTLVYDIMTKAAAEATGTAAETKEAEKLAASAAKNPKPKDEVALKKGTTGEAATVSVLVLLTLDLSRFSHQGPQILTGPQRTDAFLFSSSHMYERAKKTVPLTCESQQEALISQPFV